MNDAELRLVVSEKAGVDPDIVDRVLVAMQDTVSLALRSNRSVTLTGFGVWNAPTSDEPFHYLFDIGELTPVVPDEFLVGVDADQRDDLVEFLSTSRSPDIFGVSGPVSGMDPRWQPVEIDPESVRDEAQRSYVTVCPRSIRDRVIENLRGASVG